MTAPSLPENFAVALTAARHEGGRSLSAALARALDLPEPEARRLVAERFGFLLAEDLADVHERVAFDAIPFRDCKERRIVPLRFDDQHVGVATADPFDLDLQQWLQSRLRALRVPFLWVSSEQQLSDWLGGGGAGDGKTSLRSGDPAQATPNDRARSISVETIAGSDSAIVRFVDSILLEGWLAGASDIHCETGRDGLEVRFRLDGVLVPAGRFGDERPSEEVINRIKVLAQLDVSETRVPQDGRFRARLGDRDLDFRVSIMPSIFGEDAVIRLLDKAQLRSGEHRVDLARLGFEADIIETFRTLARLPHGMLLVTGPTGSGKTTTLYAILSEIYSASEKLITIEDPVEYELPGVLQIPVNEKKGLTFARGLRSILRHDPDRILVGEIRDQETAEIAIQAALTGHLVFTTVHANSVFDVVGRFSHMGIDLYNFMSALNGVVAQRLLRTNCASCSESITDAATTERLAKHLGAGASVSLRRGRGCEACRDTGYKGRIAIAEELVVDERFRELVVRRESGRGLRAYAAERGMTGLAERARALVAEGITTIEEVDRVVGFLD